jgi:hypothetical protein
MAVSVFPPSKCWSPPLHMPMNRAVAERTWSLSGKFTQAGRFLVLKGVGRARLGQALRQLTDWMVRDCIRVVNPSLLPTIDIDSKKRWECVASPVCPLRGCIGRAQTATHLLLQCGNARTRAHVSRLNNGMSRTRGGWRGNILSL